MRSALRGSKAQRRPAPLSPGTCRHDEGLLLYCTVHIFEFSVRFSWPSPPPPTADNANRIPPTIDVMVDLNNQNVNDFQSSRQGKIEAKQHGRMLRTAHEEPRLEGRCDPRLYPGFQFHCAVGLAGGPSWACTRLTLGCVTWYRLLLPDRIVPYCVLLRPRVLGYIHGFL